MSYVGLHPSGRRFYVTSKTGMPLAFAVYALHVKNRYISGDPVWDRVGLIEDRPHPNESHYVGRSWIPLGRDMTPREKAAAVEIWWREIGKCADVRVIELRASARERTSP